MPSGDPPNQLPSWAAYAPSFTVPSASLNGIPILSDLYAPQSTGFLLNSQYINPSPFTISGNATDYTFGPGQLILMGPPPIIDPVEAVPYGIDLIQRQEVEQQKAMEQLSQVILENFFQPSPLWERLRDGTLKHVHLFTIAATEESERVLSLRKACRCGEVEWERVVALDNAPVHVLGGRAIEDD